MQSSELLYGYEELQHIEHGESMWMSNDMDTAKDSLMLHPFKSAYQFVGMFKSLYYQQFIWNNFVGYFHNPSILLWNQD